MKLLMKSILQTLTLSLALSITPFAFADVVYLYDATGNVGAVIDPSDVTTVYSSSGDAVGYVDTSGAVYSYSGRLLGWYSNGTLFDNNGYVLAYMDTNVPATVTTPLVKRQVVINRPAVAPTIVTPTVVATPPTFVYDVSPTPLSTVLTVEPVVTP